MVHSEYDDIMTSLINYPDFKLYIFDFLLTKTMTTSTTIIIIIINIIAIVTARPIIKPVLELSLVDDVDAKIGKYKRDYKTVVSYDCVG